MIQPKPDETGALRRVSSEIRRTHSLTDDQKQSLSKIFEKRLSQAFSLVEGKKVTNYQFKPSGRTIWVVKGRKGEYQVVPESMFCTCDDYYFRVMDNKRELCYHLIAQQLAEALGKFDMAELADSSYDNLASKWSERASTRS